MPSTRRCYRLRIHDGTTAWADFSDPATATGNALVVTSARDGVHPYIAEPPDGDGQELDPITGKATIGEMHVRVIDARVGDEDAAAAEDDFNAYADGVAMNAVWPITSEDMDVIPSWQGAVSPEDQSQAGFFTISSDLNGGNDEYGTLTWSHTYDGLTPGTSYVCRTMMQVTGLGAGGSHGVRYIGATTEHVPATLNYQIFTALVEADEDGEITVEGYLTTPTGGGFIRNVWFDNVRLYAVADYPGRVVTKELADTDGYWHLLSRWAAVEVSEDAETWATLQLGFLNALRLTDALTWDFTVGETRRAELRAELYRECPVPVNDGSVLISPTCLIGGPIAGGAAYNTPTVVYAGVKDYGPARFEVISQTGHSARQMDLDLVGAWMAPFYLSLRTTAGDGNNDVEVSYPNHHARGYFADDRETWAYDGGQDSSVYGYFPGLVVELTRVSDNEKFYTVPLAVATRRSSSFLFKPNTDDPVGTIDNLIERNVELRVDWDAALLGEAKPSAGEQFDVRIWPARPSAALPIHERGHPVDLVVYHANAFGIRIDTDSATAAESAINTKYGGAVVVELVHEDHLSFEKYHSELLSYFGYALRPQMDGTLAFVGLRYSVPTDATAITLDLLRDADSPVFELGEDSIVTTAETKTRTFNYRIARDGDDVEAAFDDFPADLLQKAWHTATGATDDTVDAGDQRTHQWTLPGRVLVNGVPIDPDGPAQAAGDWLVNWRRRGVPTMELHVLPDVTADVGDEVSVNLPHLPVAVAGGYPVTERGQAAVTYRVTRRTVLPEGADLALIKAPPAVQATLAAPTADAPVAPDTITPEFTLAGSAGDPSRIVRVTITNASDLVALGADTQWQYALSATEPTVNGVAFGPVDPDTDPAFDLPPVTIGATVWVRGTATTGGGWTAWDSVTLSTLAVTPTGAWDSGTAYQPNETVTYNGQTWIAKRANTNVTPVAGDDWALWDTTTPTLALDDLSDVDTTGVADGDVLVYDEDTGTWVPGAPSGGSGGLSPFEGTITTASLADGATETGTITLLGKTALLVELVADRACWWRAYDTAAARTADAARTISTSPKAGKGVLSNAAPGLDSAGLTLPITPGHVLANRDSPRTATIYWSITNRSGGTAAVALTLRGLTLES